ncbi:MAG: putative nucleotidyltransferase substrate binding domain-containing protein [Acidobacteriota bacterium]
MQTAAILYRVADFLEQHPPFQGMEESDLLALTARGRVKFHESDEYLLWQGAPHGPLIFVIQQGTVSLWDETVSHPELRDVRGAGDMLGIDVLNGAAACAYSAKSNTDVVVYGFPVADFETLLGKYPVARRYVSAHAGVSADYQAAEGNRQLERIFLYELVRGKKTASCPDDTSIRDAARQMTEAGVGALAVVDADGTTIGLLAMEDILEWVAEGHVDSGRPVKGLLGELLQTVSPNTSVVDGILKLTTEGTRALAITADGTPNSPVQAIVTSRDVAPVFGDEPSAILDEIRSAAGTAELRLLNQRARIFILQYLNSAASTAWLTEFAHRTDAEILGRVLELTGHDTDGGCWCFAGSSGRRESLTTLAPSVVLLSDREDAGSTYQRVLGMLAECDYLPRLKSPFEDFYYAASIAEWKNRYRGWVVDPIFQQMYNARPLFDLRPVHGPAHAWQQVDAELREVMSRDFLKVLGHDCLGNLPPLTFFEDAVVDESGEHASIFELERSALRPLVDVGRVFGMAAGQVLGGSTLERFALAQTLLPSQEAIFREASETLRVVLWQQGRIGISRNTDGGELPPALLSRYDRQVLKSGFRSLHRLLEFTAEWEWLDGVMNTV